MTTVAWDKSKFPFHPGELALAWCNKNEEDDNWTLLYFPTTCRTYMNCYWWASQVRNGYISSTGITPYTKDEKGNYVFTPPAKDYTGIFFACGIPGSYGITLKTMESRVLTNLPELNALEEKYGLEKTTIIVADDDKGMQGIIFRGDAAWHSCLWKNTLYTYLLKRLSFVGWLPKKTTEDSYWRYLEENDNLHKFMSKVKSFNEEIVKAGVYDYVHVRSGFVSIASSSKNTHYKPYGEVPNAAMAKLLLDEEPNEKTK